MSKLALACAVSAGVLVGAAPAYAQTPGMICGTATDSAGANLAGVTVTLASGVEAPATTKTSAAGERLERSLLTSSAQTDPVVPVGYGRHAAGGTFTKEVVTNSGAKPAPPRHPCSAPR